MSRLADHRCVDNRCTRPAGEANRTFQAPLSAFACERMRQRSAAADRANSQTSILELARQVTRGSLVERVVGGDFDRRAAHRFDQREIPAPFGPRPHLTGLLTRAWVK